MGISWKEMHVVNLKSGKPDLIIETGIARGGSLILSASILKLLDVQLKRKTIISLLKNPG